MREVVVVGCGLVRFQRYRDREVTDFGAEAVARTLADADVELSAIDAAFCGARDVGLGPGARVLRVLGPTTMPIVNLEAASATGGVAFREAWIHIAGGFADVALAFGVGNHGAPVGHLGGSEPNEQLRARALGVIPAAGEWAMELRRRDFETGNTEAACVAIAVKAHQHGSLNPNAHRNRPVTADEVRASRMVSSPMTVYHCCPASEGAAGVLLASREWAERHAMRTMVEVLASESETHTMPNGRREKSQRVTRRAYDTAGIGPGDVDVVAAYDSFAMEELVQYEDLGFAEAGEAEALALSGATRLGGRIPFNTDGGNLSRGHAIGPTGIAQISEIVQQLRGSAGDRQVPGARVGLVHQLGASGEALTHVLRAASK